MRKLQNWKIYRSRTVKITVQEQAILEPVIDALYKKDTIKVGNVIVNHLKILEKMQLIQKENLIQLLNILQETNNIKNVTNYLMICLYNNLGNTNVSSPPTIDEKTDFAKTSLDDLYDNDYYDTNTNSS